MQDVELTGLANNDVLRWDQTAGKWKNVSYGFLTSTTTTTTDDYDHHLDHLNNYDHHLDHHVNDHDNYDRTTARDGVRMRSRPWTG
jgi:hypothetical protein